MDFITVIISLAALLLSLLSYLRERRLITVDFNTNCFALDVTKNIKAIVLNKNISIEEGVSIEFKVPQYAWLPWHRSSVSTSNRKKFKFYRVHYDLSNFHKILNSQNANDTPNEKEEISTAMNGK